MSRTFARFTLLLIAIAAPPASLRAEEPANKGEVKVSQGTLTIGGIYTGGTTVGAATLQSGNRTWSPTTGGEAVYLYSAPGPNSNVVRANAGPIPATPHSAAGQPGKAFYIITEGAGIGDNVRCLPCTGNETVLDAISQINGLAQISSTKMWIARPSPTSHDKSTILSIDWEAISRRGINATNYTLMPGDRLVLGEDPLITRSNMIGKKTAMFERLEGILGLTTSTLRGLNRATAADYEVLKALVQRGAFTDDEEMKEVLQKTIHVCELEHEKAQSKEAEKCKPGQ
ncbi:MAG: hypothetical protein ACLP9L_35680 [Thermoguttaceae bacterium]